jgi:hypothetical protein
MQHQKRKSQGLRLGECAGKIPLLISLSLKTSDDSCIDIRAVWAVTDLLKPDIESFFIY